MSSALTVRPTWVLARLARVVELGLDEVDLSLPQLRILMILSLGDRRTPTRVASVLSVSPPTVTAVVDGLVARGAVERTPDPDDRRKVVHSLTPLGTRLLADAEAAAERHLVELLGYLDGPSDRADAQAGLAQWDEAMNRAWLASCERGATR